MRSPEGVPPPAGPGRAGGRGDAAADDEANLALLCDLMDGRLDEAAERALRARLASDPALAAEFEGLEGRAELLRRDTAALQAAPTDFGERVRAAIALEDDALRRASGPRSTRGGQRAILRWMTVAYAAAALVVVGWTVGWFVTGPGDGATPPPMTAKDAAMARPAPEQGPGAHAKGLGDHAGRARAQDGPPPLGAPLPRAVDTWGETAARADPAQDRSRDGNGAPGTLGRGARTGAPLPLPPGALPQGHARGEPGLDALETGTTAPPAPAPASGAPFLGPPGSIDPGQREPTDEASAESVGASGASPGEAPPPTAPRSAPLAGATPEGSDRVPPLRRIRVDVEDPEAFAARLALVLAPVRPGAERQELPSANARARLLAPREPETSAQEASLTPAPSRLRLVLTTVQRARLWAWLRLPAEAAKDVGNAPLELVVVRAAR